QEPSRSIGQWPVSGAGGLPAAGPEVAVTAETVGTPAYVALAGADCPATDFTVTSTFSGLTLSDSVPGAMITIFVPVTLMRLKKESCENACVGSPKLTQSRVARLKPFPLIVMTEQPSSLAS